MSIKLLEGKVSGLCALLGACRTRLVQSPVTPSHVVTNVRMEKATICQIFLRNGRDPYREPWAAKAGLKRRFVQAAPAGATL